MTNDSDLYLYLIASPNLTTVDHLGVNAAIGMAEIPHQRIGDLEIADAGVRIDIGGGATHDAFDDLEPRALPDRNLAAEKIKLGPRRPALDIHVGAEAQRIDRHAENRLKF